MLDIGLEFQLNIVRILSGLRSVKPLSAFLLQSRVETPERWLGNIYYPPQAEKTS